MKQTAFITKNKLSYGGTLLKTRAGRSHGRPIDTKNSMHLVLRSSKAVKEHSFKTPQHARAIQSIVDKFSRKYGVVVFSLANVGNHLHFHIKISNRRTYTPFIRAVTAAIAMKISGASRWKKSIFAGKFWDYRPFTRVVVGYSGFLKVRDYIQINQLEGLGVKRVQASWMLGMQKVKRPLLI